MQSYLRIRALFKRFVSKTPYFIHETPKTPHITGCRVLLIVESLETHMHENLAECKVKQFSARHASGAVHFTGIFPPFEM